MRWSGDSARSAAEYDDDSTLRRRLGHWTSPPVPMLGSSSSALKKGCWEDTMRRLALATTMLFALGAAVQAADVVKLGNLTQLSGPIAPRRHRDQARHRPGARGARQQARRRAGALHRGRRQDQSGRGGQRRVQADRRSQGRLRHRARRLQYADPGVQDVRRCRHLRGRRTRRSSPVRRQGMHPNGFFVSFTNDDWPAAVGQVHDQQGL